MCEHMFAMRRRSQGDFDRVLALIEQGLGDSEIRRRTGIPRATISAWRHGRGTSYHHRLAIANQSWRPTRVAEYSYLLGVYLGDGCLSLTRTGSATLIVSLDGLYPTVVAEVGRAIECVFAKVNVRRATVPGSRVVVLKASHPVLPFAFPQHGPGRKHEREIGLSGWQREITHSHPRELLRGLIHSDGCRTLNRFRTELPSGRGGVRLSALFLLESLGRHPFNLLRALRIARDPLDAVEPAKHLGLSSPERGAPRRVRGAEAVAARIGFG